MDRFANYLFHSAIMDLLANFFSKAMMQKQVLNYHNTSDSCISSGVLHSLLLSLLITYSSHTNLINYQVIYHKTISLQQSINSRWENLTKLYKNKAIFTTQIPFFLKKKGMKYLLKIEWLSHVSLYILYTCENLALHAALEFLGECGLVQFPSYFTILCYSITKHGILFPYLLPCMSSFLLLTSCFFLF